MPILCRPNWVRSPSGKKLEQCTEQELVDEIVALGVPGLGSDMPSDKLILGWLRHLCRVIEESGKPPPAAVDCYLKTLREEVAA